jgi:hypothetical protein
MHVQPPQLSGRHNFVQLLPAQVYCQVTKARGHNFCTETANARYGTVCFQARCLGVSMHGDPMALQVLNNHGDHVAESFNSLKFLQ